MYNVRENEYSLDQDNQPVKYEGNVMSFGI